MTSKEWVKEQLSYTDDHWTTSDRIMLTKILKDLERLEVLEKAYKKVVESIVHYEYTKQQLENEKLKKAIEILKDNSVIEFNDDLQFIHLKEDISQTCDYTIIYIEDKQEYELLKEVINNE